jgi:hypothetical protein
MKTKSERDDVIVSNPPTPADRIVVGQDRAVEEPDSGSIDLSDGVNDAEAELAGRALRSRKRGGEK